MRTPEQIYNIQKTIGDPYAVVDMLSYDECVHLINLFKNDPNKIIKNTGPITLNLLSYFDDPVIKKIINQLKTQIGDFEITASFFFETDYPHIIHNDDTFELPNSVYKAITLPLRLDNFNGVYPKLCFFDQFYFHGPAKFFNGSENIPTYYNKQLYEYSDVHGVTSHAFNDTDKLFTHLNSKWVEGLSLHSTLDWIPGHALIFDSVRLHCASDFRNLGIKSKLGISIFTKKKCI
jgi:hypothetical protein